MATFMLYDTFFRICNAHFLQIFCYQIDIRKLYSLSRRITLKKDY